DTRRGLELTDDVGRGDLALEVGTAATVHVEHGVVRVLGAGTDPQGPVADVGHFRAELQRVDDVPFRVQRVRLERSAVDRAGVRGQRGQGVDVDLVRGDGAVHDHLALNTHGGL